MRFELWGATIAPHLSFPERTFGLLLLSIYSVLLLVVGFRRRRDVGALNSRQWLLTLVLSIVAFAFAQLFLISQSSEAQLPPLSTAQNPSITVAPFGLVSVLLAGAILNPMAAMIVGLAGGLSTALWQTHQATDVFHLAFAGALAATLMRQNYSGRLYAWLRQPIVAGIMATLLLIPLVGLATFGHASASASYLEALDLALSTTNAYLLPLLLAGVLGGLIVMLLLVGVPQLKRDRPLVPSPLSQSLNTRLVWTFVFFAAPLSFILFLSGFNIATNIATDLTVEQMAREAASVSNTIAAFLNSRQHLLVEASDSEMLRNMDGELRQEELRRLFRLGDLFRSLMLVDEDDSIIAHVPDGADLELPTMLEARALEKALRTGAPFISPAQPDGTGAIFFSFIVPLSNGDEASELALLGRAPGISLDDAVTALQDTLGMGTGFMVDEESQIIGHPDPANLLRVWPGPAGEERTIDAGDAFPGQAYEGLRASTNTRQLVYYQTGPDHPWTVIITVPYQVILGQALRIAGQLAIVLLAALLVFGGFLMLLGRSITTPLTELARASQEIAGGSLNTPIATQGDDEIGRLSNSFSQMQSSLKRRVDELSLLLDVSQEVSKSIDLGHGMPSVLKGALRGTGAASARIVVVNPGSGKPLTFAEGPASATMAQFDQKVIDLLANENELTLSNPTQTSRLARNGTRPEALPAALVAFPLLSKRRFQGIFWLTYRQAHVFDQTELGFLRTLSGQASVLVENARLYATAEGGRRRLAAVLTSTSDAVIVTDQTHNVLLVNPAMERYFDLEASQVVGRPVRDVIDSAPLVAALTATFDRTTNLEVPIDGGKILVASAATIYGNDDAALGRVAVLHDITYLKELDDMKSEFVATVSHDLRSPLTFMLGYTTMLPMVGDLDPKQEEYVSKILGGIEQMSVLVEDLLDLGRLDAGIDLTLIRLRMEEIIESVIEEYRQPAAVAGLNLSAEIAGNLPPVRGDAALIRQAVANYVSNAIKYAPKSGKLVIRAVADRDEVVVAVIDKGPGIPQHDVLRLFEKFYRVDKPGKERVRGSGLGLALVKSIANRHGGRAWCESEVGQGSSFYLSLPLYRD